MNTSVLFLLFALKFISIEYLLLSIISCLSFCFSIACVLLSFCSSKSIGKGIYVLYDIPNFNFFFEVPLLLKMKQCHNLMWLYHM